MGDQGKKSQSPYKGFNSGKLLTKEFGVNRLNPPIRGSIDEKRQKGLHEGF